MANFRLEVLPIVHFGPETITIEPSGSNAMASECPLTQWPELSHFC